VLRDALVAHCAGPGKGDFVGEPRVRFSGLTPEGKSRLSISWTYTFGGERPWARTRVHMCV
jgi:hypothetical protein